MQMISTCMAVRPRNRLWHFESKYLRSNGSIERLIQRQSPPKLSGFSHRSQTLPERSFPEGTRRLTALGGVAWLCGHSVLFTTDWQRAAAPQATPDGRRPPAGSDLTGRGPRVIPLITPSAEWRQTAPSLRAPFPSTVPRAPHATPPAPGPCMPHTPPSSRPTPVAIAALRDGCPRILRHRSADCR